MVRKRRCGLGESPHGLDLDLDFGVLQVLSISLDFGPYVLGSHLHISHPNLFVVAEKSIVCTLFAQSI